jgi:hypothetical protein
MSLAFGLLALFGPTLAAIVVSRSEGSFAELRERITTWSRPIGWYALAFGFPFVVAGIARLGLWVRLPTRNESRVPRHVSGC